MIKKNSGLGSILVYLKRHHRRNKNKGVYSYMWWTTLKIVLGYILIIVPVVLIAKHLIDFNQIFEYLFRNHSNWFIILVFFLSESFLGMIPPDLFVIWSAKFNDPFFMLTILGILSYIGGIISYFIGYWFSTRPSIKAYSERMLDKYIVLVRKWGGAFIIIAALFPFSPFSMVIMAVSLLKYPLKYYMFFGIVRIARFPIQGLLYLGILNMDTFFAYLH
jgi:membrane protein YqaA with SNARE-associated domain